jgi:hypothetical protein
VNLLIFSISTFIYFQKRPTLSLHKNNYTLSHIYNVDNARWLLERHAPSAGPVHGMVCESLPQGGCHPPVPWVVENLPLLAADRICRLGALFWGGGGVPFNASSSNNKTSIILAYAGGVGWTESYQALRSSVHTFRRSPFKLSFGTVPFSNLLPMLLAHSLTAKCCLHKIMQKYLLQVESYEKEVIEYRKLVLYASGGILLKKTTRRLSF